MRRGLAASYAGQQRPSGVTAPRPVAPAEAWARVEHVSELEAVEGSSGVPHFTDNLIRLLGLHALSQNFAAELLAVSPATMSSWLNGKSSPSLAKAVAAAELFEVPAERLTGASFADLLAGELADPERFARVEERIRRRRSKLRSA